MRVEGLDGLLLKGVGAQEPEPLGEEGVDDPGLGDDDLNRFFFCGSIVVIKNGGLVFDPTWPKKKWGR